MSTPHALECKALTKLWKTMKFAKKQYLRHRELLTTTEDVATLLYKPNPYIYETTYSYYLLVTTCGASYPESIYGSGVHHVDARRGCNE